MKTTFKKIKKANPCQDGWEKLICYYKPESYTEEVSIAEIVKSNGIKDAVWALRCINNNDEIKKIYLFCADIAESVLIVFEKKHPQDVRPRKAIEAIRSFVDDKISRYELNAAANAADAAGDAAYADDDATNAAYAAAADAAANAAYAAGDAAHADDDATNAAYAAAAAAAAYAAYAAANAADDAAANFACDASKAKWQEIKELLLKYLQ